MAVKSVKERFQARRSGRRDGKSTHTLEWLVTCDDVADGTAAAIDAVPATDYKVIPAGSGELCKLSALDGEPHQSSDTHFLVRAEYSGTGLTGVLADPLKRPAEISYQYQDQTEDYFTDCTPASGHLPEGRRVCTSAGELFAQNLTRETADLSMTITVNQETFSPVEMDRLKHTLNRDAVTLDGTEYAPGTLKLSAPSATKTTEKVEVEGYLRKYTYYKTTYTLKARADGWDDTVLDVGTSELVVASGAGPSGTNVYRLLPITDSAGLPVTDPWPLDGHGRKKPRKDDPPATLTFKPYRRADWSGLKFTDPAVW